jgi:hypothetical protein
MNTVQYHIVKHQGSDHLHVMVDHGAPTLAEGHIPLHEVKAAIARHEAEASHHAAPHHEHEAHKG